MKRTILVLMITCLLAFAVNAQAMMGTGGSTGTTTGSTGMMGTYMQMPTGQQMFEYGPTTYPVMGTDISTSMPLGVGSVATGGNMITLQAAIGQFVAPMDMYITAYAPSIDPFNVFVLHPSGSFHDVSTGFEPWMTGVTSVDQTAFNISTSELPKGTYTVGLMATPTGGNMSTFYMWTTHFVVQ